MKFFQINTLPVFLAGHFVAAMPNQTENESQATSDGSVGESQEISSIFEFAALFDKVKTASGAGTTQNPLEGRSLSSSTVSVLVDNLNEYGCWCYFDDHHGQGRGQPVDDFDSHCSKYHHAVACAKLEIEECNPYETSYTSTVSNGGNNNNGDIDYDCETGNDPCQRATCYAQAHFISLLMKELTVNLQLPNYNDYRHSGKIIGPNDNQTIGDFDKETCKIPGGTKPRQEMCCGKWHDNTKKLLRFGAHLNRGCCDQPTGGFKTYDENMSSCCDDGSIRVHGTC